MRATIDSAGRVVIPKAIRDRLGVRPGDAFDVSEYNGDVYLSPDISYAELVEEDGLLVARGTGVLTDEMVRELRDAGRR